MEDQYWKAVKIIQKNEHVSISAIQRHCRIGYNQGFRLVERMQAEGIISKPDERGFRSVLDFYAEPRAPKEEN